MRRDRLVTVAVAVAIAVAATFSAATPMAAASTMRVPVLMYHRFAQKPPAGSRFRDLYVTPAAFDAQLSALKARGWHTITAVALGDDIRLRRTVPAGTFVISVDDGHSDGYMTAWPIMQKYGFVGTFYVVTGHIGHPGFLTWDMAAALAGAGNEIANHTVSHVSLPSSHGKALVAQIDDAASAIEAQLALRGVTTTVRTFAYPYGHTSHEATQLLATRGYTLAVTTVFGLDSTTSLEPLLSPRVRVSRGESLETFLSTLGGVRVIEWRGQSASGSSTPAPLASASPVALAVAAASPAASLDNGVGSDLAAPTAAPDPRPENPWTGTSMDQRFALGGLGILVVLLLTAAATLHGDAPDRDRSPSADQPRSGGTRRRGGNTGARLGRGRRGEGAATHARPPDHRRCQRTR